MSYGQIKTSFMEVYEELLDTYSPLEEAADSNELPNGPGIYCIVFDTSKDEGNIPEKKYVGQAVNIGARIKDHKKAARPTGRDHLVYQAMRDYPYKVTVLEECEEAQLDAREQYWIKTLHTYIGDSECRGFNMTAGGKKGTLYYTPEIIAEIISIYKSTNYNHTETVKLFREKYKDNKHLKLCHDTLKLLIKAAELPWYNEQEKATIVYANHIERTQKVEKDGHKRSVLKLTANNTDLKYKAVCKSQVAADDLVNYIWKRVQTDCEADFKAHLATCTKREREKPNVERIKWLIDQQLYDKYLDLSQYDLTAIPHNKKSLGGEGKTISKVTSDRGGLCTICYNVSIKN